jgi:hypothetical protein
MYTRCESAVRGGDAQNELTAGWKAAVDGVGLLELGILGCEEELLIDTWRQIDKT